MRFTRGMFRITKQKVTVVDRGKQQNLMPGSLSDSGQSTNGQHNLPVMAISLAWHYGAAFPAEATITTLQTMEPCFHLSCWAPALPCPWPKSLPGSDHCRKLAEPAQRRRRATGVLFPLPLPLLFLLIS